MYADIEEAPTTFKLEECQPTEAEKCIIYYYNYIYFMLWSEKKIFFSLAGNIGRKCRSADV